ncbi:MAG: hypothetical protein M3151_09695 [Actinomycetota bacterium]|nr:hypothetical protein [Actinomycetota bacterium]
METMQRANRSAEQLARTGVESYKMVIDHVVGQQERNVRFAREIFDGVAREMRDQAESNRALAQELVERAENQRGAFQTLVEESVDAYREMLYTPLSYYRQGLRVVEGEVVDGVGFPISNYDELNVKEIADRLDSLSAAQIRTIREYEKRNKSRETLIEQFDRRLKAASA